MWRIIELTSNTDICKLLLVSIILLLKHFRIRKETVNLQAVVI